jgi:hypothetical protein
MNRTFSTDWLTAVAISSCSRRGKVVPDLSDPKSRSAIETEKQAARHLPIIAEAVVENPTSRNLATSVPPKPPSQTDMAYTCLGLEASSFSVFLFAS